MVTRVIIFLMCFAFISTMQENRESHQCTHFIFENTTDSKEFKFFNHVEQFFQKHEIGKVLSSFLDKGDLTLKMKHKLTANNNIRLELLRIGTASSEKDFFVPAVHDTSKQQFLNSVRNAFYTAYYDADSKHGEQFDAMLEDSNINSYFEKIQTRPVLIYTEMLVTSKGIHLNLIQISSTDYAFCFLNQFQESEFGNQITGQATRSYQDEEQGEQQKFHRFSMVPRRLYNENEEEDLTERYNIPVKKKAKTLNLHKNTYKKNRNEYEDPSRIKNLELKVRKINKKAKTTDPCLNKRAKKRRLPSEAIGSCETKRHTNIVIDDNLYEIEDDYTEKRSNAKRVPIQTNSVLYHLIMKEIDKLVKHDGSSSKKRNTVINYSECDESEVCAEGEDDGLSNFNKKSIVSTSKSDSVLYQLIMNDINKLGKNRGTKRTHAVKKTFKRGKKVKKQTDCENIDKHHEIGTRRLTQELEIGERKSTSYKKKVASKKREGYQRIKKTTNQKTTTMQKSHNKVKSFTIELRKLL